MANYRAIATVCQAVVDLLDRQYRQDDFKGSPLEFRVIKAGEPDEVPTGGITLFLHKINPDASSRASGRKGTPGIHLTLNFILTAWGKDAGQQQRILGWAIETLNDNPVLSAETLNAVKGPVFDEKERVELVMEEMDDQTMMRISSNICAGGYQLSVAYSAEVSIRA